MAGRRQPAHGALSRLTYLVAGVIVGVIGGVFIGIILNPTPDPVLDGSAHIPPLSSGITHPPALAPGAPAAAPKPPAADLDLGHVDGASALQGEWQASVDFDFRHAAVTTARQASVVLEANPHGGVESLLAVVRAVGLASDESVRVSASTDESPIATWTVSRQWQLVVGRWPTRAPLTEQAVVDLELQLPADAKVLKGQQPGLAIDQLWLTRPVAEASLQLRTANGQSRLLSGFWQVEQTALGMLPAVWSRNQHSTIGLVLRPAKGDYVLRVRAEAYGPIAPVAVAASINDKPVGSSRVDKLDDHRYTVPAGVLVYGVNTVRLEYADTARPVDHGEQDDREISIRLFELVLAPSAG